MIFKNFNYFLGGVKSPGKWSFGSKSWNRMRIGQYCPVEVIPAKDVPTGESSTPAGIEIANVSTEFFGAVKVNVGFLLVETSVVNLDWPDHFFC